MTSVPLDRERLIAGHRVLRLLARGDRSRVWLAAGDVVLKVLSPPVGSGQPSAEAEALHRACGEHVVELLDVSTEDDQVVLVFPRLPRGSLAEVLSARAGWEAGEAVTALAPLAGALARMHAAGVAHGALTAANVLFRADGAPLLVGFGAAHLFDPGLPEVHREQIPGVIADRAALAGLAAQVLAQVTGPRAVAAAAFAASLRSAPLIDLETRLGRELFELAAARPIVLDRVDQTGTNRRAIGVVAVPQPVTEAPSAPSGAVGLLGGVLESGVALLVRQTIRARWQAWPPGRRKTALGVAAAVLVLLVAIAVVPAPAAPEAAPASPDPPVPAADGGQPAPPSAVTGDDPLAALPALLRRRTECFRDLSVLCLDDVDELGSAALDSDRAALAAVLSSGATVAVVSATDAAIVERLGDSVLIALAPDSDPASVLLLKGEAGWRIRDYLAGGASAASD